jgi:hypothetical protein
MLLAMGLVLSAFVGAFGTAGADHTSPTGEFVNPEAESAAHAFFPWVPNGNVIEDGHGFGETGPWYGSVTLQNLEEGPALIDIYVAGEYEETIVLMPWASTTLSAADLNVPDDGASIEARGYQHRGAEAGDEAMPVCLIHFEDGTSDVFPLGGYPGDAIVHCAGIAEQIEGAVDSEIILADHPDYPADLVPGEAIDAVFARIAGVQKQASPEMMAAAQTGAEHETVGGYTGMSGDEVADTEHMLPIVQTNNNWNTIIRVANFGDTTTPVTVTFYESFGAGATGTSAGSFTENIGAGEVATFDLVELGFADEAVVDDPVNDWVGTAFISANQPVGAAVERIKTETDMLIMNTSQPMGLDFPDFQAAPLVFQEFNFWNTGISVANLSETENNTVTITYYGPTMNVVGQDQLTIPPRGMEYVYTPGTQDLGLGGVGQAGFVGSAKIEGTSWFHASVDEVKYFGDDEEVGHAMSYIAEWDFATGATIGEDGFGYTGDMLALPLVQKGVVDNGIADGDTSGIQLFNVSPDHSVTADVTFYDSTGLRVAPTLESPISVTLSPHQNYTLYAHDLHELPTNFQGSAVVEVSGLGALAGVSNNVNYSVQHDGSAAFNLVKVPGEALVAPPEVDITLEPEEAENPFYGQAEIDAAVVAAIEAELADLGFEIGEYDVAARLAAHGGVIADLVDEIQVEFGLTTFQTGEVMTAAEAAAEELNQHTVTATVTANGEVVTGALVQFDVTGANEADGLVELEDDGTADFTYTATAAGEDLITATVPGAEGEATATKTWVGVGEDAVGIVLDPEVGENDFYTDIVLGQAQAIAGLGIEFFGDDAEAIYAIIQAEGADTETFVVYLEGLVAAEEITEEEFDLIVDAWLGVNVHTVTSTFVDAFGNPVNIAGLVDTDFDVEVQVLDQFGTPQDTVDFDLDVDADTGVATIAYTGDPIIVENDVLTIEGSDLILISVTLGEGDDAVTLTGEATKTWNLIDVENGDNGDNGDNGNGVIGDVNVALTADDAVGGGSQQRTTLNVVVTGEDWETGDEVEICREPGAEGEFDITPGGWSDQDCYTVTLNAQGEASVDYRVQLDRGESEDILFTATHVDSGAEDTVTVRFERTGGGPA